jgi:hypothetical protein
METDKMLLTDEWIKKMWYLYTMKFYSATKKNEIMSFSGKWIKLENIILNEVRLRRPKIACSSSSADYRPKTNAAILWDMGHTKGRLHPGGIGQGKETKTLNVVDVLTGMNTEILKLPGPLLEGD